MWRKKDELTKALEEVDREQEDKAWAKKKALYGDTFHDKKFYELSAFWPNFWAWFWILIIWIPTLTLAFKFAYKQATQ